MQKRGIFLLAVFKKISKPIQKVVSPGAVPFIQLT
jgi:hypothetical protein